MFICTSFGCKREREALGAGSLAAPESCAVLRSAVLRWDPLLPSEHAWGAGGKEGSAGMVSTLGLNFLALVPVLLLSL